MGQQSQRCKHCGGPLREVASYVGGRGVVNHLVCIQAWNMPVYQNAYACGAPRPVLLAVA